MPGAVKALKMLGVVWWHPFQSTVPSDLAQLEMLSEILEAWVSFSSARWGVEM